MITVVTHSCIASGIEDRDATSGCQGLSAGDYALCAVHDAPPAAELGESGLGGKEVFWWEWHLGNLAGVTIFLEMDFTTEMRVS